MILNYDADQIVYLKTLQIKFRLLFQILLIKRIEHKIIRFGCMNTSCNSNSSSSHISNSSSNKHTFKKNRIQG